MAQKATRVLAIDGGGIRGIVPALVLAEIEGRSGRPTASLFELIAGTSTGGLLALALTKPADGGDPAFSAAELVDLYEKEGPRIFSRSLWQQLRSLWGLRDEKYSDAGLNEVVDRYLGEARLAEALTDVIVTAYETGERFPFFFKSARARTDPDYDFPIRIAARATSAAPTYFEPALVVSDRRYSLVDGGLFAVNPAMSAYAEARRDRPESPVALLSLGTGRLTRPYPFERIRDWGLIRWVRPLIDMVFDGMSEVVDYQLRQVEEGSYWRLQLDLTDASDALDDASPANLRALRAAGERLIAERSHEIDAICERLTAEG